MADLDQVVTVNIGRETSSATPSGFGTAMFLGEHRRFTERYKSYKSAKEVLADGFKSTDVEYIAATKYFSQELKPTKLAIGRRKAADISTLTFEAGVNGKAYSITINGVVLTYTASSTMTAIAVADAFEASNTAGFVTAGITFSDSAADGTATVSPVVAGTPIQITSETATITVAHTFPESLTDALAAVEAENPDFFVVLAKSHIKADQLELATAVEAMSRIYITSTSDVNVKSQSLSADTTSIAKALYQGSYVNTACMYSAVANQSYPEAAWAGYCLSYSPGQNTWKFKTLNGITFDALSTTEINNIRAKSCNYYTNISNIPITGEGVVAGQEYLDVMIGVYWLKARLQERLFDLVYNLPKLPLTETGLSAVLSVLLGMRQEGIAAGLLSGSDKDKTFVPKLSDISFADKAARTVNNIGFDWQLSGAMHFINVQSGTVSL